MKAFQFIPDHTLANTRRRSGKYQVTDIDGEIIGNVSDDLVEAVDHDVGIPLLHQFLILVQTEVDVLFVLYILERYPFADSGRIIPGLGLLPRKSFFLQFILNVPRSKIDTGSYRIIVFTGKPVLDVFSIFGNTKYQLTFIMQAHW